MFDRLNRDFTFNPYKIKGKGMGYTHEGRGIQYYHIHTIDEEAIFSVIPERFQNDFCLTLMSVNCEIPPHTDSGILTTINFYIQTEDCETNFFEQRVGKARTKQIENQTDGFIFDEADLELIGGFIAKPNEAWLLDVTKPHSVKPRGEIKERLALSLSTGDHDYQAVFNLLKEGNYL